MSGQATARPWVEAGDDEENGVPFITIETAISSGPDSHRICRIEGDFDAAYESMAISPRNRADAALIVRAVNCHDELLEALEYVRANLGDPVPIGRRHVARIVEAAIARARGEQA